MNDTAINESALNATNQTVWSVNDITDVKKTLNWLSDSVCEMLISWGHDPSYVLFVLLLALGAFALIQHFFIKSSSSLGGILKYPAFAVLLVAALLYFGII